MLKTVKNLGKSLTKEQQKEINGGWGGQPCNSNRDCWNSHPFLGPGDISCRFVLMLDSKRCVFN